jgi:hypothetical protein
VRPCLDLLIHTCIRKADTLFGFRPDYRLRWEFSWLYSVWSGNSRISPCDGPWVGLQTLIDCPRSCHLIIISAVEEEPTSNRFNSHASYTARIDTTVIWIWYNVQKWYVVKNLYMYIDWESNLGLSVEFLCGKKSKWRQLKIMEGYRKLNKKIKIAWQCFCMNTHNSRAVGRYILGGRKRNFVSTFSGYHLDITATPMDTWMMIIWMGWDYDGGTMSTGEDSWFIHQSAV